MPDLGTLLAVRQDFILTNVALQFRPVNYIADLAAPPISVSQEDGQYTIMGTEAFNAPNAQRRPKKRYKEIDFGQTKASYHAEEYGLEFRVDDRERRAAPNGFNLESTGTENLTAAILNNREIRIATMLRSTANLTQNTTLSGADRWDDTSGGDPIGDIDAGAQVIEDATGIAPNTVIMPRKVFRALRRNPVIRAELLDGEQLTLPRLAELFSVERIIISSALYNTKALGQTPVMGDVWGKDVILCYTNPNPADGRASLAYQLRVDDLATFRWRDVPVNCDVFRVREIGGEKIISTLLGYLLKTVIS